MSCLENGLFSWVIGLVWSSKNEVYHKDIEIIKVKNYGEIFPVLKIIKNTEYMMSQKRKVSVK